MSVEDSPIWQAWWHNAWFWISKPPCLFATKAKRLSTETISSSVKSTVLMMSSIGSTIFSQSDEQDCVPSNLDSQVTTLPCCVWMLVPVLGIAGSIALGLLGLPSLISLAWIAPNILLQILNFYFLLKRRREIARAIAEWNRSVHRWGRQGSGGLKLYNLEVTRYDLLTPVFTTVQRRLDWLHIIRDYGASQHVRLQLGTNGTVTDSFWKWNKAIHNCRNRANIIFSINDNVRIIWQPK